MTDDDPIRDSAAWEVVAAAAESVVRRSWWFTLEEACEQLGVDADRVRGELVRLDFRHYWICLNVRITPSP